MYRPEDKRLNSQPADGWEGRKGRLRAHGRLERCMKAAYAKVSRAQGRDVLRMSGCRTVCPL